MKSKASSQLSFSQFPKPGGSTDTTLDQWLGRVFAFLGSVPILITLAIIGVLVFESVLFFQEVPLENFLTDTQWTPTFAGNTQFGIIVLASATILVTLIAVVVAIPIGILGAIYLAEYASASIRRFLKPALETLSGIPTVVYGYFALLVLTPALRQVFPFIAGFNALSAGIMVGILVAPTISSLSEDALRNLPSSLRQGAYALGFTKSETIVRVLLPAAFPGVMASITLAISQALGETMIVAIAAGQRPNLTFNPFVPVATMTGFIIQVSLGTVQFGSLTFKTIFTVGMVLFSITLLLNSFSQWLTHKRRVHGVETLTDTADLGSQAASDPSSPPTSTVSAVPRQPSPPRYAVPPTKTTRFWFERGFRTLAAIAAFTGIFVLGILLIDLMNAGVHRLDWEFLTSFASRKAEESGIYAPLIGTLWIVALTGLLVVPVGVGAAIFLHEYYPDTWMNQAIRINIANLAAVPSIIYGLLGLELFVRVFRPLTGGYTVLAAALTLAVVVLPLLIIASYSALRDISDDLRQGGYAVGMSKTQLLYYLVIPAAFPGLLTGTLLALSRAVGETAALIAVGAVASIRYAPPLSVEGLQSQYTVLPVQIFYWLQDSQQAVRENAAAATIVLIAIVILLNVVAILLRDFSQRRAA